MARPDLSLLDMMAHCQRLIIVDAVMSRAAPGTLHRREWRADAVESRGVERASSHGFGVGELLSMAAALDRLPPRVELWGIEIASTASGPGLTPAVERGVANAAAALQEELERMTGDG